MRRQDRPKREPKKPKSVRVAKHPEPVMAVKKWTAAVEPLQPRSCPYRHIQNHHQIVCPACLGFPEE